MSHTQSNASQPITRREFIQATALAGAALLKYADKIPGLDDRTSGLLKGAAGLLSGSNSGTNAATNPTNAPATNSPTHDRYCQPIRGRPQRKAGFSTPSVSMTRRMRRLAS